MYNTVCNGFYPICPINWCPIFHVFADTICWYSLFIKMHFQLFIFHKLYLADIIMSKIQFYLVCPITYQSPLNQFQNHICQHGSKYCPNILYSNILYLNLSKWSAVRQVLAQLVGYQQMSWQYQSIPVLQQNLADKNVNITRKIIREPPDQSLVSFKSDMNKTSKMQLSSCSDCHCDKTSVRSPMAYSRYLL